MLIPNTVLSFTSLPMTEMLETLQSWTHTIQKLGYGWYLLTPDVTIKHSTSKTEPISIY